MIIVISSFLEIVGDFGEIHIEMKKTTTLKVLSQTFSRTLDKNKRL